MSSAEAEEFAQASRPSLETTLIGCSGVHRNVIVQQFWLLVSLALHR